MKVGSLTNPSTTNYCGFKSNPPHKHTSQHGTVCLCVCVFVCSGVYCAAGEQRLEMLNNSPGPITKY